MDPGQRQSLVESRIKRWEFQALLAWADQTADRLSPREELFVAYARERSGDAEAWHRTMLRLRQRVFHNEVEYLAYRALSLQTAKDLRRVAADLQQLEQSPDDLLMQLAWVRVADRLAAMQDIEGAWELYSRLPDTLHAEEWLILTHLKATVVGYLSGRLHHESVVLQLRKAATLWPSIPLSQAYGLAFHLYISSISARWFDQVRLQNQLRMALEDLAVCEEQPQLLAAVAYLLNPEHGLGAALWKSQLPTAAVSLPVLLDPVPEMLWFSHCIEALELIQRASQDQSLQALQQMIGQQERLGNGLLTACARSRWLGHMLHQQPQQTLPHISDLWFQELKLLQAMPYNELQSFGALLHAAHQYRQGDYAESIQTLRRARRLSQDRLRRRIISLWLTHARGRMPRPIHPELMGLSLQLLRYFFAPSLKSLGNSLYLVSDVYRVDLSLYPVLNRLLQQILRHPQKTLLTHDVQNLVWRQTASLEGWKQKLRNAVARLRLQFRYMLAPVVIQSQGLLRLNMEALSFGPPPANLQDERKQDIMRVLQQGPCSVEALMEATCIPGSTLRRYLKTMLDQGLLRTEYHTSRAHTTYACAANSKD